MIHKHENYKIAKYLWELPDDRLSFQLLWMLGRHWRDMEPIMPWRMKDMKLPDISVYHPYRYPPGKAGVFAIDKPDALTNAFLACFVGRCDYPIPVTEKMTWYEPWRSLCIAIPDDPAEKPVFGVCKMMSEDDLPEGASYLDKLAAPFKIRHYIDYRSPYIELPNCLNYFKITDSFFELMQQEKTHAEQ